MSETTAAWVSCTDEECSDSGGLKHKHLVESPSQTTAVAGDQWTPKTLMEACMHIRSLEEEHETFRQEAIRWRLLLQEVIDDMTFNVAPSNGTMAKIREAMQ